MKSISILQGQRLTGIILTFASTAFLGFTFLFSKIALDELNTRSFVFFWMLHAALYATVGTVPLRQHTRSLNRRAWTLLILTGIANLISSYFFFTAIDISPQPALVSFLAQLIIIPSLAVSLFILKEKIAPRAYLGIMILVTGALLLTYVSGPLGWQLLALVVVFSLANGFQLLLNKLAVAFVEPIVIVAVRAWISSLGAFVFFSGIFGLPSTATWLVLATGAFFGPFLSFVLRYFALRNAEAWIVASLSTTLPLFVAVYDALILGKSMSINELFAGALVIIGALQISVSRRRTPEVSS
jgi:drug/metabolite transporter (DMT)-like permease